MGKRKEKKLMKAMKITTPTTPTPTPTPTISLRTNGIIGFLNLNHSPQYHHLFPRTIVPPNTINYYCYYYASLSPSPLLANILSLFFSFSLSISLTLSFSPLRSAFASISSFLGTDSANHRKETD